MSRRRGALLLACVVAFGAGAWVEVRSGSDASEVDAALVVTPSSTSSTTTTTSTTATTTTTTTTVPPLRTARLLFTGDLLPHGAVQRAGAEHADPGWDFTPLFAEVRPLIEGADLAICHLESPISIDDSNLSGYPMFNAPRAFAEAARDVGYDGCSLASNHSFDRGAQGAINTITVMREIGLPYAGQAASEEEDLAPVLYRVNDIVIAHISATYSLNGFQMPADRQYLVDLIDPEAIVQEARIAKEAGAEFVVVSLHWGAEYRHEPIQSQIDWLDAILPTEEVDLVVGHHAHVVQPIDKVGDEWVVFGVGNFLSNQSANCCVAASQDGMIATIELRENDAGEIEAIGVHYIPTWVDRGDGYVIRLSEPGRTDVPDATAATLEVSYDRTLAVVSSRLTEADGLTIGFGLEPGASSVLPATDE